MLKCCTRKSEYYNSKNIAHIYNSECCLEESIILTIIYIYIYIYIYICVCVYI